MKLCTVALATLAFVAAVGSAYAQTDYGYYERTKRMASPAGAMKYGAYGVGNPAVLATMDKPDLFIAWRNPIDGADYDYLSATLSTPGFSFTATDQKFGSQKVTDYTLAFAGGDRGINVGFGFGWSTGAADALNRANLYSLGVLARPNRYLSIGGTLVGRTPRDESEIVGEIAVRPLGTPLLALFADYVYQKQNEIDSPEYSFGAAFEVQDGVRLTGRYFDGEQIALGVELSLGHLGASAVGRASDNGETTNDVFYGVRLGGYDRTPLRQFESKDDYFKLDMKGTVAYQRFEFFGMSDEPELLEIIQNLEAARRDETVKGVYVSYADVSAPAEFLWEIREELKRLKNAGKEVVVYMERGGMNDYYLASVADRVVMHPLGMLEISGYLMGRTYYKGTLEKLGVGVQEFRYFKYKSAVETFSREEFSEADEEQRRRLIESWFAVVAEDIEESRGISESRLRDLMNDRFIMSASEAKEAGLIDEVTTREELEEELKEEGSFTRASSLYENKAPTDRIWGAPKEIAVVYGLGVCATDFGLNARSLSKKIRKLAEDDGVAAVVFRADSPGGDALASDLVLKALEEVKEKKPVVVTQGAVAGSGGYWISLAHDKLFAAPNTVTGSIGVIFGWAHDAGLKEDLGVSTDKTQIGEHADLGFGMAIPLLGSLPDRAITEEEEARFKKVILETYEMFVAKVAKGRDMPESEVREVAQGRVWSGTDGYANGLIDEIGGMRAAIEEAADLADLAREDYVVREYPDPVFSLAAFMPKTIAQRIEESAEFQRLRLRLERNGTPLLLLPRGLEEPPY
jgi:protease IV